MAENLVGDVAAAPLDPLQLGHQVFGVEVGQQPTVLLDRHFAGDNVDLVSTAHHRGVDRVPNNGSKVRPLATNSLSVRAVRRGFSKAEIPNREGGTDACRWPETSAGLQASHGPVVAGLGLFAGIWPG